MRELSNRVGGVDEKVRRCICGAWTYEGNDCAACATLRGVQNGMDEIT